MFTQTVDVVTAIADDLEANGGLPQHALERGFRPPVIKPSDCPMLAVWSGRQMWTLIATPDRYFIRPEIVVAWFVASPEESETADGFARLVAANDDVLARTLERLGSYAKGVPTLTETAWARIVETETLRPSAMVLEFRTRLEVETS